MLLRGSTEAQERRLTLIGGAVLLVVVLSIIAWVWKPFGANPIRLMAITIDTPFVGQGVDAGTPIVLHGVTVGKITEVTIRPGGGARLAAELQKLPLEGLTDSMTVDFRPVNYFGVPGMNIVPQPGGRALREGSDIAVTPKGNFTLSELLSQLGQVSKSALTPQLIAVIDRTVRYTDGLNPLFETLLTVTTAVADVQVEPTAQLLRGGAAAATGIPPFTDAALDAAERFISLNKPIGAVNTSAAASGPRLAPPFLDGVQLPNLFDESEEFFYSQYKPFADLASNGLFAAVGKLQSSHIDELLPLVDGLKAVVDIVPAVVRPANFAETMVELRSRFEKLYAGNGQQPALQVRVVLDYLPAVAAPLGVAGEAG